MRGKPLTQRYLCSYTHSDKPRNGDLRIRFCVAPISEISLVAVLGENHRLKPFLRKGADRTRLLVKFSSVSATGLLNEAMQHDIRDALCCVASLAGLAMVAVYFLPVHRSRVCIAAAGLGVAVSFCLATYE